MAINILLCSIHMDLTKSFYKALGVELREEKHGKGPKHFSFADDVVMEIYPPRLHLEPLVLRIQVEDVEKTMKTLKKKFNYGAMIHHHPEVLESGIKVASVRDPDERMVEIYQPKTV